MECHPIRIVRSVCVMSVAKWLEWTQTYCPPFAQSGHGVQCVWVVCVCSVVTTDMVITVMFSSFRREIIKIERMKSILLTSSHSHIVGMGCVS